WGKGGMIQGARDPGGRSPPRLACDPLVGPASRAGLCGGAARLAAPTLCLDGSLPYNFSCPASSDRLKRPPTVKGRPAQLATEPQARNDLGPARFFNTTDGDRHACNLTSAIVLS